MLRWSFAPDSVGLMTFPCTTGRPHIRLTDTDDPIRDLVRIVIEHVLLLLVDLTDRFQILPVLLIQLMTRLNEAANIVP